jgi:hypothetical protein
LAAYLGFKQVADLRFLMCTWPVLKIWQLWHANAKGIIKKFLFYPIHQHQEVLETCTNPSARWPDKGTLEVKKQNGRMRVAWGLVQLKMELDRYAQMTDEENKELTDVEWQSIEAEYSFVFPKDGDMLYPVPTMGPLPKENEVEPFGRAFEILQYLSWLEKRSWNQRFTSVQAIRNAPPVLPSQVPLWMRPKAPSESEESPDEEKDKLEVRECPIEVTLLWVRDDSFEGEEELEEVLSKAVANKETIPPASTIITTNLAGCTSGAMFRDVVRHHLNCQKLGVNLREVRLCFYHDEHGRLEYHSNRSSWRILQGQFSDHHNKKCDIKAKLAAVDEADKTHSILECSELLPGMLLEPQPQDLTFDSATKAADASAGLDAEVESSTAEDLVTEGQSKTFATKAQQLAYYSDCNVQTSSGRRKWQLQVVIPALIEVCPPEVRKDKPPEDKKNAYENASQAAHHNAEGSLNTSNTPKSLTPCDRKLRRP